MTSDSDKFDAAIRDHDAAIAACGLDIWIGAEPTFTNRWSESPEWLTDALGATKQTYAMRIVEQLSARYPGSLVLRTLGRQYPGESLPRWSIGLYHRRDGRPLGDRLPADPLDTPVVCDEQQTKRFWQALIRALDKDGWAATGFRVDDVSGLRILFRCEPQQLNADPAVDPRLARAPLQSHAVPESGSIDELANEGLYLLIVGPVPTGPDAELQPGIELPGFTRVAIFQDFLDRVRTAAGEAELASLVWRGYPPPVDESVSWTTLTPDPAVVEVNAAPATSVTEFLQSCRYLYGTAESQGLASRRLQYNGDITDSGGGGQFTIGGPSPAHSPFFRAHHLLAHLVIYLNRHPALSYWFAPRYVGSHSQSPRPDENVLESFSELRVALQHYLSTESPDAEFIWRSLSPFLVDTSGNAHRSELNIEKLWNPYLPGRGCLGLVEFRAFRMSPDAETAAAVAALLRTLIAMLSKQQVAQPMIEWGSRLHDRFALPFYLRQDLEKVFADLEAAGLGLGSPITDRLVDDDWRHIGHAEIAGCRLDVDQAIEFWPLLGDAAIQDGGSRLVDASTARLQLKLRPGTDQVANPDAWRLLAGGYRIPLRQARDALGSVLIMGLRYRAFTPRTGLHPGIGAQVPVVLTLLPPGTELGLRITLHDWQPQGLAYDGLPASLAEAKRRISERFVVEQIDAGTVPDDLAPPADAVSGYCFDLRRI